MKKLSELPLLMDKKIKEILLKNNLLTRKNYEKALSIQKKKDIPLFKILLSEGLISENNLLSALSERLNLPAVDLNKIKPELPALKLIPVETARYYNIIPLSIIGKTLTIVTSDPQNILAIDDLKSTTGYNIRYCLSTKESIAKIIEKFYSEKEEKLSVDEVLKHLRTDLEEKSVVVVKETEKESLDKQSPEESVKQLLDKIKQEKVEVISEKTVDERNLLQEAKQTPVVKLVDYILLQAYQKRASDIHLEPYEKNFRLRYRIDGILHEETELPKGLQSAIIARLKIMSNLDITERRVPQDGRFRIKVEDKEIDYRVSVLPISFGEKIVLRALDKSNLSLGLTDLGFSPESLTQMQSATSKPYGMILVTGPTGSGKSTTLYSVLNKLNTPLRNIITIEDPVEYQISGITQIAVKAEIGLTFAKGLRAILRQSPDIILIGEIRDFETADTAVKAALTGQLVLSTLHTNDAPGAITRLIDMGVEPFLIASSVIMISAQRLMRKICDSCKEEEEIPQEVLEKMEVEPKDGEKLIFYHGKGCEKCHQTGYRGRMATAEVMLMSEEIKELTIKRSALDLIRKKAIEKGMITLRDNAIENFKKGFTTLEEVMRITSEE